MKTQLSVVIFFIKSLQFNLTDGVADQFKNGFLFSTMSRNTKITSEMITDFLLVAFGVIRARLKAD
jgi:hypothetical protein